MRGVNEALKLLTIRLQEKITITLDDLQTYKRLSTYCLLLDLELKRINSRPNRLKRPRSN